MPLIDSAIANLVDILLQARTALAHPENDFVGCSWEDANDALREIDAHIASLRAGQLPRRMDLEILVAPTGRIQDVSLSDGWGDGFLVLANRFDAAVADVYGPDDPLPDPRTRP